MRLTLVAGLSAMLLAAPAWAGDMKGAGKLSAEDCVAQGMPQSAEIQPEGELQGHDRLSSENGTGALPEPAGDVASDDKIGTDVEEHAATLPSGESRDEIAAGESEDENLTAESERSEESFDLSQMTRDKEDTVSGQAF
jgi:hypothetical protein